MDLFIYRRLDRLRRLMQLYVPLGVHGCFFSGFPIPIPLVAVFSFLLSTVFNTDLPFRNGAFSLFNGTFTGVFGTLVIGVFAPRGREF